MLLPGEPDDRPMVLSFVYEPSEDVDAATLIALLQKSVQTWISQPNNSVALPTLHAVSNAAASAA